MALEKLKNIFENKGTTTGTPESFSNLPIHTSAETEHKILIRNTTLDNVSSFSPPSILSKTTGTNSEPAFPTDYTAINTLNADGEFVNNDVLGNNDWTNLYNADHTSKIITKPDPNNPFQPNNYPNMGDLQFRKEGSGLLGRTSNLPDNVISDMMNTLGITGDVSGTGIEPYIVSRIPAKDDGGFNGYLANAGGRNTPLARAAVDTIRVGKYLSSNQGISNMLLKNADLFIRQTVVRDGKKLRKVPQRFNTGYNPLATLVSVSPLSRLIGHGPIIKIQSGLTRAYPDTDNKLLDKISLGGVSIDDILDSKGDTPKYRLNDTFTKHVSPEKEKDENSILGLFDLNTVTDYMKGTVKKSSSGDKMTLAKMIRGKKLKSVGGNTISDAEKVGAKEKTHNLGFDVEDKKEGMPFYFKDLRDNSYIFFRAYMDGLNENITPSWAETTYIGRSESVYVYERATRSISFNLTLFAQTSGELKSIYQKMNKLTSLCYPQYAIDEFLSEALSVKKEGTNEYTKEVSKTRMKPPLCKFRLGELFGKENKELLGFIETLSYTIPDGSTWETENGKKVPKYIQAAITFKVIHEKVPEMTTKFYGYQKSTVEGN